MSPPQTFIATTLWSLETAKPCHKANKMTRVLRPLICTRPSRRCCAPGRDVLAADATSTVAAPRSLLHRRCSTVTAPRLLLHSRCSTVAAPHGRCSTVAAPSAFVYVMLLYAAPRSLLLHSLLLRSLLHDHGSAHSLLSPAVSVSDLWLLLPTAEPEITDSGQQWSAVVSSRFTPLPHQRPTVGRLEAAAQLRRCARPR